MITAIQGIPSGYKQTDMGIIPEDWEIKKLDDLVQFTNGKAHEQFINNTGTYTVINSKFISTEGLVAKFSKIALSPLDIDDIVMVMSDIPKGKALAKCFYVKEKNKYTLNQRICSFKAIDADSKFLYYKINRNKYFLDFDSGVGQTNLKREEVLNCSFALPQSVTEQSAIAYVLSDIDYLIEKLIKLIAKKRAIKQGSMQELLTGKRRLPGFSEEWESKKLGETAILKARIGWQGLTTAEYKKTGDFYLITGTEFNSGYINWDSCYFVNEERYKQDKNIQIKAHDILVTKDGTIGKVALVPFVPKPATLNSGVFVIRPIKKAFHPEFFYYILLSEVFLKFLSQLSAGSTINHLYQKDFVTFQFLIPKTLDEQLQIAQILSGMDEEIEKLETRLEKYRQIKQGAMQVLLTGKVRLIKN